MTRLRGEMSMLVDYPFCKETEFDLVGLRHHLMTGECEVFDATLTVAQERERRQQHKVSP